MSPEWNAGQRSYYDATSGEYEDNFEQGTPYFEFVADRFYRAVRPEAGERLLEFGISGGRFTAPLLERGCRITGIDLSPESLRHLEQRLAGHPRRENLSLVADDITALTRLKDSAFDAVIGAHILHHVLDIRAAAVQAFSRLRPGGRAVFLEPNPFNPLWYIQNTCDPKRSWSVERGLLRVWPGTVRRAFLDAGFGSCGVETFACLPPQLHNHVPGCRAFETVMEGLRPLAWLLSLNLFTARKG